MPTAAISSNSVKVAYEAWLLADTAKADRLSEIRLNIIARVRDAILTNRANTVPEDTETIPRSCVQATLDLLWHALAMEMGLDISTAGSQAMIRADLFIRQIAYGHFVVENQDSAPSPSYVNPSATAARQFPTLLAFALFLFAPIAHAGWISPGSTIYDTSVNVTYTPASYVPFSTLLSGHLSGIDSKFSSITSTLDDFGYLNGNLTGYSLSISNSNSRLQVTTSGSIFGLYNPLTLSDRAGSIHINPGMAVVNPITDQSETGSVLRLFSHSSSTLPRPIQLFSPSNGTLIVSHEASPYDSPGQRLGHAISVYVASSGAYPVVLSSSPTGGLVSASTIQASYLQAGSFQIGTLAPTSRNVALEVKIASTLVDPTNSAAIRFYNFASFIPFYNDLILDSNNRFIRMDQTGTPHSFVEDTDLSWVRTTHTSTVVFASNDTAAIQISPSSTAHPSVGSASLSRRLDFLCTFSSATYTGAIASGWSSGQAYPYWWTGSSWERIPTQLTLANYQTLAGFNSWSTYRLQWVGSAPTNRSQSGTKGELRGDVGGTNIYIHNGQVWGLAFTINTNALPP